MDKSKVYLEVPEFTGEKCTGGSSGKSNEKGSAVYTPGHYPWISEIRSCLQEGREQPVRLLHFPDEVLGRDRFCVCRRGMLNKP